VRARGELDRAHAPPDGVQPQTSRPPMRVWHRSRPLHRAG
jgi:hypothetical protein